jgi:integrase
MLRLLEQHFGRAFAVDDLSQHHVDAYAAARRSGAVRSPRHRGTDVGVRDGTIRNELHLLTAMLRWARGHKVAGRRLLTANPLEGVAVPQEANTRRPVATEERYRAVLALADRVDPRGRFRAVLVLARHTGRRVNAICQLLASDVLRTREQVERALGAIGQPVAAAAHWPHGALRWRAATDKRGYEAVAPLGAEARAALDAYLRDHPRVGEVPLFPATGDDAKAAHKVLAGYWLRRAETLAGLPRLERGAWHTFRRLWASERRHLPAQDVMAAGGWRDVRVMQRAYQHADPATVFAVVATPHAPAGQGAPTEARPKGAPAGHTLDTPSQEATA